MPFTCLLCFSLYGNGIHRIFGRREYLEPLQKTAVAAARNSWMPGALSASIRGQKCNITCGGRQPVLNVTRLFVVSRSAQMQQYHNTVTVYCAQPVILGPLFQSRPAGWAAPREGRTRAGSTWHHPMTSQTQAALPNEGPSVLRVSTLYRWPKYCAWTFSAFSSVFMMV